MGARFLGIDGGGSSTRAWILDESGQLVQELRGGPSNVVVVGEARARQALDAIVKGDATYDGVVAGIAGADRPWVRAFWESVLGGVSETVWVMGDYRIAWAALTDGDPGLVAIFGTGSVFYAECGDTSLRIGGYGWKIGDVGSGIALGRHAVEAALGHMEGWAPATSLTEAVVDWAKARDKAELLNYIYRPDVDWRTVSDLAGQVFVLADRGDMVAEAILKDEAAKALRYLETAHRAAGMPPASPTGLAGGLAHLWHPRLEEPWRELVGRPLVRVTREPVEGAARLARSLWGKQRQGGDA